MYLRREMRGCKNSWSWITLPSLLHLWPAAAPNPTEAQPAPSKRREVSACPTASVLPSSSQQVSGQGGTVSCTGYQLVP